MSTCTARLHTVKHDFAGEMHTAGPAQTVARYQSRDSAVLSEVVFECVYSKESFESKKTLKGFLQSSSAIAMCR